MGVQEKEDKKIKKYKDKRKKFTKTIVEVAGETSKGKQGICPTHWSQSP